MRPTREDKMSLITDATTRTYLDRLEHKEASRAGITLSDARRAIARRLGLAPGTLENLRRGRTKGVRAFIAERVRAAMIREIESDLVRLTHELQILRQAGSTPDRDEVLEIAAGLQTLREALKKCA